MKFVWRYGHTSSKNSERSLRANLISRLRAVYQTKNLLWVEEETPSDPRPYICVHVCEVCSPKGMAIHQARTPKEVVWGPASKTRLTQGIPTEQDPRLSRGLCSYTLQSRGRNGHKSNQNHSATLPWAAAKRHNWLRAQRWLQSQLVGSSR